MKKKISQIIMFIGVIVAFLGMILDPLVIAASNTEALALLVTTISLKSIAMVLAVAFIFTKNNVLINIGYGLGALVGIYGLVDVICNAFYIADVGFIIMLLAAILYAIFLIVSFFGYVKGEGETAAAKTDVTSALNSYKDMQNNEIITEEEYEALKSKVLSSVKVDTVNDLKKWKKLLDQKIITEEEFAAIKANIFKA